MAQAEKGDRSAVSLTPWAHWTRGLLTGIALALAVLVFTGQVRWW